MSNEKPKNNRFNFTSFDGTDENGLRAEVRVKVNRGKIKEIKPSQNGAVVHIEFSVEKAKYPIAGWAPVGSEAHKEAERALANDEEIEYRIETQRRAEKGVPRTTPIDELNPRDEVKSLVVAINGKPSGEGVTNPAEDNKYNGGSGRYVAGDEDAGFSPTNKNAGGSAVSADSAITALRNASISGLARPTVLDALAAQALLAGATPEQVNQAIAGASNVDNSQPRDEYPQGFATEAKPWNDYNSDGRVNLGSARVSAGVGIENLVFKHLAEVGGAEASNFSEVSEYLTSLIFAICDVIQAGAYGSGARPDRVASSHARVRGVVYETIQKHYTIPVTLKDGLLVADEDALKTWAATVGRISRERFLLAVRLSQSTIPFKQILPPASLIGKSPAQPVPSAPAPEAPASAPVASAPQVAVAVAPATSQEDRVAAARQAAANPVPFTTPTEDVPGVLDTSLDASPAPADGVPASVFSPRPAGEPVDPESEEFLQAKEEFMGMIQENGMDTKNDADLAQIASLLRYTFNTPKLASVDPANIYDLVDHYVAVGAEGLREAIQYIHTQGHAA